MISTNLKIKVITWQRGYNESYALNYLNKRKKDFSESKKQFQDILTKYNIDLKGKVVLDLAAGTGMDLKILSEFQPGKLIWHDKMKGPHKIARENLKDLDNVVFYQRDLMDLEEYEKNSIDFIICRDSLGYICNDYFFFREIKSILKPGGFFWGRNNSIKFYKKRLNENRVSLLRRLRHKFFDWPLYRISGLKIFSFLPIDSKRLKYIFHKLNFKTVVFKKQNNRIEIFLRN
jgi:ubiquinone/menaquinone biosynthesis C-methylase UbiE